MSSLAVLGIAFVAGFAMDLVWTLCVDAVTRRQPLLAANMSAILYLCTIVSTVLVVEKCFTAVAAYILGGWLGTYTIVTHRQKLNHSEPIP